jgi:hypothetical protein
MLDDSFSKVDISISKLSQNSKIKMGKLKNNKILDIS